MGDWEETQWVRVASFLGLDGDVQADLLVTTLRGAGLAAVRLPVLPTTCLPMANWPMIRPALVFVPGESEADAREIVAENPQPSVRPEVRTFICYALVLQFAAFIAGAWAFLGVDRGGAGDFALEGVTAALLAVAVVWVRLVVALHRDRRRVWDGRVVAIAVVTWGVLGLLALPFVAVQSAGQAWEMLLLPAAYALVVVILSQWLRGRRGRLD